MSNSYWTRVTESRLSRRRLLRGGAAAGAGVAALSLIGCGDDDAAPATGTTPSPATGTAVPSPTAVPPGLVAEPEDTTSRAVRGGVAQRVIATDPQAFDSIRGTASDVPHASRVYSRLVKYEVYKSPEPVLPVAAPDAATEWEVSPDGLRATYKIRPNFLFDPRPPTNHRAMTSEDVKYSVDRFLELSVQRGVLSNEVNEHGPIVSTETPDASTFVVNLAFPYAPLNMLFGAHRYIVIMPIEADGEYDIRSDMRGSGAWRLKQYSPSVNYEYERNADWYDADKVYLEGHNFTVSGEAASNMAQFRAGNVWQYEVPQEDVLRTKRELPKLVMLAQEEFNAGSSWIRFGFLPGSPFFDERVRQAASMSLERDLFIDVFGNVDVYAREGIEVPSRWNSVISAGEDFWIDPKDRAVFGEGAKFFQYDPAEARKLLQAAGITPPLHTKFNYSVGFFGGTYERRMEVLHGMWQDSGNFRLDIETSDYNAFFGANITNGYGRWEGLANAAYGARAETDVFMHEYFHSASVRAGHLMPNGEPDTELDRMVERQRGIQDLDERTEAIADIQRYVASKMYFLLEPGQALGFTLNWPWLQNFGLYRSKGGGALDQEGHIYWWYDESQRA